VLLDLRWGQWRRVVLLHIHHILATQTQPNNDVGPILLDETAHNFQKE